MIDIVNGHALFQMNEADVNILHEIKDEFINIFKFHLKAINFCYRCESFYCGTIPNYYLELEIKNDYLFNLNINCYINIYNLINDKFSNLEISELQCSCT